MPDVDRTRLIGTYSTPRFHYGDQVFCERRGQVEIVGLTDALIPWPIGKRGRSKAIIHYGDLAEAVKLESASAVGNWFGVGSDTVWKWRVAMGIGATTEGTSQLRRELGKTLPEVLAGLVKGQKKAREPEAIAKMAAARRGKPRPRSAMQAAWKANRGRKHTEEARKKMSQAHRSRGTIPPWARRPWTPEEDDLVRIFPAIEVATLTGRTLQAVYTRRSVLGLNKSRTARWSR
jgi:NUMOD3 motif